MRAYITTTLLILSFFLSGAVPLQESQRGDSGFAIYDVIQFSQESVFFLNPLDPVDFRHGGLESNQYIFLRPEALSFRTGNFQYPTIAVDIDGNWLDENGNYIHKFRRPYFGEQRKLPNGPRYNSYYLHLDPIGSSSNIVTVSAKIQFENPIVGIIFTGDSDENFVRGNTLDITDGIADVDLPMPKNSDFRRRGSFDGSPLVEFMSINSDRRTITVSLACKSFHLDNLRIITLASSEK